MTKPFDNPIYVARPILPDLARFTLELQDIWQNRRLANKGPKHNLLEDKLTECLKVPYLSLFNNGTIALITACQGLHLSGEVITTPFTFAATPHVLRWNNVQPVFCDIDPLTMNIDVECIASLITSQTTGILAVHVYGTPCDVFGIQAIADLYGLKVVYDAAHAFGVEIGTTGIGNFGDATMFSFHATKLFHTAEGGALTFRDQHLKNRVDLLKNFGIKNEEEVVMPGINGKLNEIQAALGLLLLDEIEAERTKRARLWGYYCNCLQGVPGLTLPTIPVNVKSWYQYFVIRINHEQFGQTRDHVYNVLRAHNVFARKYFYPLCSEYPCYRQLPSANPANLPVAHQVSRQVLCLPFYGDLAFDDVERICGILIETRKDR